VGGDFSGGFSQPGTGGFNQLGGFQASSMTVACNGVFPSGGGSGGFGPAGPDQQRELWSGGCDPSGNTFLSAPFVGNTGHQMLEVSELAPGNFGQPLMDRHNGSQPIALPAMGGSFMGPGSMQPPGANEHRGQFAAGQFSNGGAYPAAMPCPQAQCGGRGPCMTMEPAMGQFCDNSGPAPFVALQGPFNGCDGNLPSIDMAQGGGIGRDGAADMMQNQGRWYGGPQNGHDVQPTPKFDGWVGSGCASFSMGPGDPDAEQRRDGCEGFRSSQNGGCKRFVGRGTAENGIARSCGGCQGGCSSSLWNGTGSGCGGSTSSRGPCFGNAAGSLEEMPARRGCGQEEPGEFAGNFGCYVKGENGSRAPMVGIQQASLEAHGGCSGRGDGMRSRLNDHAESSENGGDIGDVGHSNLFVGNLPEDATDALLRHAFSPCGKVQSCRIFTRNQRTCALVKMADFKQATAAVKSVPAFSAEEGADPRARWVVKFAEADVGGQVFRAEGKGVGKGGGKGRFNRDNVVPSDNLYVKGLPMGIAESQLQSTFSRAGKVVEMKILTYPDSKECSALIRMGSIEDASAAIDALNGTAPDGSVPSLTIRFHGKGSPSGDNLYVKGLPLDFSQEDLQELFGSCGTVRRCKILPPPPKHAAQDSAALVQMGSPHEAHRVIEVLSGRVPSGVGPQMSIRFAEPKADADQCEQIPSDNIYAKGLPLGTPDFSLRAVFSQFGTVVRLKVLEPKEGKAMDCAALVQMSKVSEAKAVVEGLNGQVLSAPAMAPMRVRFSGKEQAPGSNLYVAGLPLAVQERQLREAFGSCGTVVRLKLLQQPGRVETHALVQMATVAEAEQAIGRLNGKPPPQGACFGPTLVVRYATKRAQMPAMAAMRGTGPEQGKGGPTQRPET